MTLRPSVAALAATALTLAGAAASASAQSSRQLPVGSPDIRPSAADSRAAFTVTPPAPAAPTVLNESLTHLVRDGRQLLMKATMETSVDGVGGDTLVMDGATLAPVTLVTYGGGRTRNFRFDGPHITGDIANSDGSRQHVDTTFGQPVFAGPSFFTVLSSLQISDDLDVTVPFFRPYDRKLVMVRYRTLGMDTYKSGDATVPAWRVVGEIDGSLAIYWLRRDTHALLRVVSFGPGGYGPIVLSR